MNLPDEYVRYVRSLLRMDHTRCVRRRNAMIRKWGDEAETEGLDRKILLIEEFYRLIHPNGCPSWDEDEPMGVEL